jgi:hypothetical protein
MIGSISQSSGILGPGTSVRLSVNLEEFEMLEAQSLHVYPGGAIISYNAAEAFLASIRIQVYPFSDKL